MFFEQPMPFYYLSTSEAKPDAYHPLVSSPDLIPAQLSSLEPLTSNSDWSQQNHYKRQ